MTADLEAAVAGADLIVICTPTFAHEGIARGLAHIGSNVPVLLNPGHTGGALEVRRTFLGLGRTLPAIAEFSTLTYVARKYEPGCVTVTGKAKSVRLAALPGADEAAARATRLFPAARLMPDVLASGLANVNMVLHVPGAVLGAAWVEATNGGFSFYVEGMTPGVARTMHALDDERRAVARAFHHDLPSLTTEMQAIGTVEASVADLDDFAAAIASGVANRKISAPDSLRHRYYREDICYGLLPFTVLAGIAKVEVPLARSLLHVGGILIALDPTDSGRTAERMGIAGLDREALMTLVGGRPHGA